MWTSERLLQVLRPQISMWKGDRQPEIRQQLPPRKPLRPKRFYSQLDAQVSEWLDYCGGSGDRRADIRTGYQAGQRELDNAREYSRMKATVTHITRVEIKVMNKLPELPTRKVYASH